MQDCNILNNGVYAFYASSCNDQTTIINATNNWWGIADSASIEAMVYHKADNPDSPVIDFVPFADSAFEYDDSTVVSVPGTSDGNMPSEFALLQNYPNPFNPVTTIGFYIPRRSYVSIVIYNLLGQQIKQVLNEDRPAGYHMVFWDGTDSRGLFVSTGIYLYRLRAGDYVETKKMLLLK